MSQDSIKPINVAEELSNSFLEYSMSVIISRALPDVRDGLKPSQRRVLYAMRQLGVTPGKAHVKCAKIVGETMGNYHPHGDQSIYSTLVNMGQPWSMREMLVDGQGNFGSVEGDAAASMRYTEARLHPLGMAMMEDLDKDTVDFQPNYDGSQEEPSVLPSAFPNFLVNGGTGIAVGMATNLAPHNLGEVIDGICAQIDHPEITLPELMQYIKGPDFPVSCEIRGIRGIEEYFRTGRGSMRLRGKVEIEENEGGKSLIVIREVPYGVNRAVLQERIAELVGEKTLTGISGMRDLSDEETRIEIELKRDARPQVVVAQLFKLTALETSFSVNMLAIHKNRPKQLSLKEAIDAYIEHRREVIIRRTRFLLGKAEERAELLEAYLLALGHLDDFIKIIRDSKNRDEARERLAAYEFSTATAEGLGILIRSQAAVQGDRYVFSERQVNAILELRLYQLTGLERDKVKGEYDEILETIKDLLDILAREERVLTIIKDELRALKEKHATPRKCPILAEAGEVAMEELIANDAMIVTLSHRGYIKRTPASEYRLQGRGGKGLKGMETKATGKDEANDFIEHLFSVQAHDYLMFFTNTGRVYVERVYQLPEGSRTSTGRSIKNVLDLKPEEKIAALLRLERSTDENGNDNTFREDAGFVFFATRNGKVKKTSLHDFRNYRKAGLTAINLEEGNDLIGVNLTSGEDEIVLVTRDGMSIKFTEGVYKKPLGEAVEGEEPAEEESGEEDAAEDEGRPQIRPQGRATAGVTGIRMRPDDYVVGMAIVSEDSMLLVASENGLGKRTAFSSYRALRRGGRGVKTLNVTDKTGKVVSAVAVTEEDELMLMTSTGQSIRIRVNEIRETGRVAQGVKLLTLKEGEKLQDIALVVPDGEDATVEAVDSEGTEAPSE
ncbi:MAG: DNA gyrase subunit A [Verrucomicrobia bacterium]|nr:MAG: DNA gyrase subunit A [Verrucomicrobiota bacterium]TAE86643.1 MAG: DNA gyrase subunit A [Verrucomicrobiota bacterium]TAF24422.1 MAG: DNA gyrase subunit A [Verrucomicrobiota bacterium]TAF39983.1 MAG: DNA gyrase subunit A [Verrucomicrobiota bacterium]